MGDLRISGDILFGFFKYLKDEEKSPATIQKYSRDVKKFAEFAHGRVITKGVVVGFKNSLKGRYTLRSINTMLASVNSLVTFAGHPNLKARYFKVQQKLFIPPDRLLTKDEYFRLVGAAVERGNNKLALIMRTLAGTGIRISELEYITVDAVERGFATVDNKGKERTVIIVSKLQKLLSDYVSDNRISSGSVFVGSLGGKPLGRYAVWKMMKEMCPYADIEPMKVYPHNFRHLFARVFYEKEKDAVKLADILGHSSINTTRIYLASAGDEHRRCMERMDLV